MTTDFLFQKTHQLKADDIMQCLKCKNELSATVKFCPECGIVVPKPEPLLEPSKEEILTTYEAAKFLKVSRWKIYDLIRKKQMLAINIPLMKKEKSGNKLFNTQGNE